MIAPSLTKQLVGYIFLFFCFLYGIILCALFFIQIYNHTFFINLGEQQYNTILKQSPPRASIYDRHNKPLAVNKECLSAFVMPRAVKDHDVLRNFLAIHYPKAVQQFKDNGKKSFMFIKRKLTEQEQKTILGSGVKDIYLMQENHRFYPFSVCGSLVGLTDIDNNGAFGIEYIYNNQLQGTPTTYLLQKDARSGYFYLKKEIQHHGSDGLPVQLTIDADLQFLIDTELKKAVDHNKATKGSVIIIDPSTGDILTAASFPTFDPNKSRELIIENTKNNALVECYEPGSVMKIFVALAALDQKIVTPDEIIDCKNSKTAYIDGRQVNTWKASGKIPFYDVIAYSNNIGIAIIAQRLKEKLFDHYKRLGFGDKASFNFPGQPAGFVNHPNNWSKQSAISLSYGYEVTTTPLQLALAFNVLCNGGYFVEPRLVLSEPVKKRGPLYKPEDIHTIQQILHRVTEYGTTKFASLKGYDILAKTGSASTIIDGHYTDDVGNYTCAGIVRKGQYQRVIVVHMHVPHSKKRYAATIAAPLFKKVAEKLVIHDAIV